MTGHKELFAFAADIARKDAARSLEVLELKAENERLRKLLRDVADDLFHDSFSSDARPELQQAFSIAAKRIYLALKEEQP